MGINIRHYSLISIRLKADYSIDSVKNNKPLHSKYDFERITVHRGDC